MSALLSAVSHFSLLRGVLSPETICQTASSLGYTEVALTDLNNLYGLPSFLQSCKEHGLHALIGAQISGAEGTALLFAHGDQGYGNLCRIITEAHCRTPFRLVDAICRDSSGIHALTDDLALLEALLGNLPVYYRLQRPRRIPARVKQLHISCLIAPCMVFRSGADFHTHRLLRAVDRNTIISKIPVEDTYGQECIFMDWDTVRNRFEVFDAALAQTEEFAARIVSKNDFGKPIMPRYQRCSDSSGLLRDRAFEGARWRYGELNDAIVARLNYELDIISKKNFADYFLIVDDIVRQSPRTCGRGSGAASIVSYSLGITNVDPIRYNLMFERFLNPGRSDPPDIDIDFAWDERDEVIKYVFDTYGTDHAAMVATHQTCGARMAIRETARIHGLTEAEISRVSKKIPWFVELPEDEGMNLEAAWQRWPTMKDVTLDPPWPHILDQARSIMGIPRGIGTHCGGVVITPGPIDRVAPVQYSAKGVPIIQWEKDGAEAMGLIKIDLLGNRSLAVIRDAMANMRSEGVDFDEGHWDPQSDPKTVSLLADGVTMGVFYVESPAMRLLQRKTAAGDFEHMVIHSSIIRPAANKYIQQYIKRLHGAPWDVVHPLLREALKETFGIMVYQEDVSRVAVALADFTPEQADMLRKIMAKKTRAKTFEDYRKAFFEGALNKGIAPEVIQEVWSMMLSFTGYSFCKPHSASYVQVSFQSAYLKAHFPAAFMAGVLSNYGGFYTTQAYISEVQRLGITIVPPDVNSSRIPYYSHGTSIITGLCQIKGLSLRAQESIVSGRKGALYGSMQDFLTRSEIDESDAEKLVMAGACDKLCAGVNRGQQFWLMRSFYRSQGKCAVPPDLQTFSAIQLLRNQYRMLGFLAPQHPVTLVRCPRLNCIKVYEIERSVGHSVTFLGWCVTSKTVSTRNGDSMEFVTFEDETGLCETVFFPDAYQAFASLLCWQSAFLIHGKVSAEFGVAVVEVGRIEKPH